MNVEKRLKEWVEAGIIDQVQSLKIAEFERDRPSANWMVYSLVALGIFAICVGIVSVIAANWDEISPTVKLFLYFMVLFGVTAGVISRFNKPGVTREALLGVLGLLPLAGIGLISQIFHLDGESYRATLFWLLITLPVTLQANNRYLHHIWMIGFYETAITWIVAASPSSHLYDYRLGIAASLPYFVLGAGYGLGHLLSPSFWNAARTWSYIVLLGGMGIAADIAWSSYPDMDSNIPLIYFIIGLFVAAYGVYFRSILPGRSTSKAILTTLALSAILIMPPLSGLTHSNELAGCVLFILMWFGAAASAAIAERRRLFDLATLVIGIRFIVAYFQVFGSLVATGIGLIFSGLLILAVAMFWHRHRKEIAKAIKEAAL